MLISFPNATSLRAGFGIVGGDGREAPTEGFDSALDGKSVRVRNHWHVYELSEEGVQEIDSSVSRGRSVQYDSVPLHFHEAGLCYFSLRSKKSGRMKTFVIIASRWSQKPGKLEVDSPCLSLKTALALYCRIYKRYLSLRIIMTF